ncbi:MAG: hypothetical protein ABGX07_07635, partial [Pirellulaceae bacterium]
RFQHEFQRWKYKTTQIIPTGFENTDPVSSASHEVIVLGPAEYYDKFRRVESGDDARRTLSRLSYFRQHAEFVRIQTRRRFEFSRVELLHLESLSC